MSTESGKTLSYARLLEISIFSLLILYWGRALLIPLSFAWLLSIILYPACRWLESKKINRSIAIAISLIVVILLMGGLFFIIGWQLSRFKEEVPALHSKLILLLNTFQQWTLEKLHISIEQQLEWFESTLLNLSNHVDILLVGTVDLMAGLLFFIVMVPLFAALLLFYRRLLVRFVYALLPPQSHGRVHAVLNKTIAIYHNYVKGLLLIYLIVAILNSTGLALLGLKHAILYGTLASLLTIIPYVGITVGSLLPITIAWLTYDSVWYPLGVIMWFTFVQYLEANILFPWIIGQRLKVNMLISLVALFVGGLVWGASGMVLFLPFIAILKIITENISEWKALNILLGQDEKQTVHPSKNPERQPILTDKIGQNPTTIEQVS